MLYSRYLEWSPSTCTAWCRFAELERSLGESQRARQLYELASQQPQLDVPEVLWKVGAELNATHTIWGRLCVSQQLQWGVRQVL